MFAVYRGIERCPQNKIGTEQKYYNVTGEVIEIIADQMICKVFLAELGEQEIKLSASMPGWFLREKAEFSAKMRNDELFDIRPLLFLDLKEDDMFRLLCEDMS